MQKVLVVDNSALMRRNYCDIINADKDFHVVDMSINGEDAYNKIHKNSYDVVILGMTSPRVDGVGLLRQLQEEQIAITVILISTTLPEDMERVRQAMSLGAYDYVCRLTRFNGVSDDFARDLLQSMRCAMEGKRAPQHTSEVADRVSRLTQRTMDTLSSVDVQRPAVKTVPPRKVSGRKRLIALACSTGGPQALQLMMPMIPADIGVPIVLVQHMPAGFTDALARRLDQTCAVHVKEAKDQDVLEPGCVYIAPGGKHMEIKQNANKEAYVSINDKPPINSLKPCADVMYESLIHSDYAEIICVVLTGMGMDGTKGITALSKHKKIYVITESQDTCVVYGMPKSIVNHGLADKTVPINQIADAIIQKLGD